MSTHSLTPIGYCLKLLAFLPTHCSGTSTPLQDDPANQGKSSFTQYTKRRPNLQAVYSLERRYFL
ncbi:hypothetical protein [Pantanalinema sp. GBBB05]|uniref:hypothetical protein n=1 Tax=Pantanalinema sp. GBBB05 TaxID=2604139 RepID=UPI001DEDA8ED|nr:hypothetical protein [Pantanalinema sp. GBBB05]